MKINDKTFVSIKDRGEFQSGEEKKNIFKKQKWRIKKYRIELRTLRQPGGRYIILHIFSILILNSKLNFQSIKIFLIIMEFMTIIYEYYYSLKNFLLE